MAILEELLEEIQGLKEELREVKSRLSMMEKPWYSRQDLAALKAMKVSAFYRKPWLLPGPPVRQGGRERWSYQQVFESGWIWASDEDLKPKARRSA